MTEHWTALAVTASVLILAMIAGLVVWVLMTCLADLAATFPELLAAWRQARADGRDDRG